MFQIVRFGRGKKDNTNLRRPTVWKNFKVGLYLLASGGKRGMKEDMI